MTPLRQRMVNAMVVRGLKPNTQEAYVNAVYGLAKYYHRSPDQITAEEAENYLLHLMQDLHRAYSTCNQVSHGLRFLYHTTLGLSNKRFVIPCAKEPQKLPEILSHEEITSLFEVVANNIKQRTILMTTYGAGLRVSEVCRLKISDIDSKRMSIRVDQGKGGKDRYTLLSPILLEKLRRYWSHYKPSDYIFMQRDRSKNISRGTVQKIYYNAKAKAAIKKQGGIHSLRHTFATHLLEGGTDLHTIKELMGHSNIVCFRQACVTRKLLPDRLAAII